MSSSAPPAAGSPRDEHPAERSGADSPVPPAPSIGRLTARIAELGLADRRRLDGRLGAARKQRDPARRDRGLHEVERQVSAAERRLFRRAASVPDITFPEELPVSAAVPELARTVQFDRIDPEVSRDLFIRHALVERDWQTRHPFFAANQQALDEIARWEDRTRRRDIVVDDETLFALYDARIPADVTSGRHFDSWWKKASRRDPGLLTFTPEMLIAAGAERFDAAAYPDRYTSGELDLPGANPSRSSC